MARTRINFLRCNGPAVVLLLLLMVMVSTQASAKRPFEHPNGPSPQSTGGGSWKGDLVYLGGGVVSAITVFTLIFYICRWVAARRATASPSPPPPPGADEAKIDTLKTVAYTAPPEEDGTTECVLCLEEYTEGEPLTLLPCEHSFHSHCARRALLLNSSCPCCRHEV